eukprot:scaffold222662_cov44-Prasinocladus_malaysianus.AAC.1
MGISIHQHGQWASAWACLVSANLSRVETLQRVDAGSVGAGGILSASAFGGADRTTDSAAAADRNHEPGIERIVVQRSTVSKRRPVSAWAAKSHRKAMAVALALISMNTAR